VPGQLNFMKSNSQSRFGASNRFKTLPDGRRLFLSSFPWAGYYEIPDGLTERKLLSKTRWEILLIFLSLFVVVGTLTWLFSSVLGRHIGGLMPATFFLFAVVIRWALYRNEIRKLRKIDYESAISSFNQELSKSVRSHSKNSLPNYEISALLDIPNGNDKIIMLKYTESFPNILRCRLDGSIVWQAELPTASDDVYTNVEWKDGQLTAFSRSLISVQLDLDSGKILPSK
jgi:hypothetical protein